jgi:hypothetical protein
MTVQSEVNWTAWFSHRFYSRWGGWPLTGRITFAGFAGVLEGAQRRHHVGAELAVEFPSEALLRAAQRFVDSWIVDPARGVRDAMPRLGVLENKRRIRFRRFCGQGRTDAGAAARG